MDRAGQSQPAGRRVAVRRVPDQEHPAGPEGGGHDRLDRPAGDLVDLPRQVRDAQRLAGVGFDLRVGLGPGDHRPGSSGGSPTPPRQDPTAAAPSGPSPPARRPAASRSSGSARPDPSPTARSRRTRAASRSASPRRAPRTRHRSGWPPAGPRPRRSGTGSAPRSDGRRRCRGPRPAPPRRPARIERGPHVRRCPPRVDHALGGDQPYPGQLDDLIAPGHDRLRGARGRRLRRGGLCRRRLCRRGRGRGSRRGRPGSLSTGTA